MTGVGVIVAAALDLVVLVWVVTLLRRDRLYVGYGVIFTCGAVIAVVVLGVPFLRGGLAAVSETLLPVPSLLFIPIVILVVLMLYAFVQISVLANRVTRLTQELAIRDAHRQHGSESKDSNDTISAALDHGMSFPRRPLDETGRS